jgi:hypothetical protein
MEWNTLAVRSISILNPGCGYTNTTILHGAGAVLWQVSFDAGVREAILADVDGDGRLEIIVETDDGRVRVLKGS